MYRIPLGKTPRYCDGLSRRSFLQLGVAGMGAAGLGQVMQLREASAAATGVKKDTAVILLWLDGGPGHMDMYDMKPEAPPEYRGIWRPIKTNVSGIEVTELFPLQAQIADKFSIVRSLHHDSGDHFTGGHWMLTGRNAGVSGADTTGKYPFFGSIATRATGPRYSGDHFTGGHWMLTGRNAGVSGADTTGKYPFFGSIATRVTGPRQPGMIANVAVPYAMSIGLRPGYFGGNYLGAQENPFETEGDPNNDNFQVRNLSLESQLTLERLNDRRSLIAHFDNLKREADKSGTLEAMDRFDRLAFELVTSEKAREAFDLSKEDAALRERYGRHSWGQSTLLARRLVEAGATFVTCHFGGWDHHWNLQSGYENYLPKIDQLVSALFTDLSERGLYDKVLVVLCGEFSRTPRMNDGGNGGPPGSMGTPGRDHWGAAMCCLLGGGGVKGGRVIGSTNRLGEAPQDHPLRPGDIHHTIFHVLGVDPEISFPDHAGRPIPAIDHGAVIQELF